MFILVIHMTCFRESPRVFYSTLQHEYQHQLEFGHDDAATKDDGRGAKQRTTGTLAKHTAGALKGTGHRGRQVAVAADRRRAERAQGRIGHQEHLGDMAQDAREAQRARWVIRMQQQQQQGRPKPTGATGGVNLGEGKEARSRAKAKSDGQPRPSQQSAPLLTTTAIPSSSIRRRDTLCESCAIVVGKATSVVAERKQVSFGAPV